MTVRDIHIEKPTTHFLEFMRKQKEEKEKRRQEILKVADLLFQSSSTKSCPACNS